jgi:glycosyltransferase involved in cell wall biosynthesis
VAPRELRAQCTQLQPHAVERRQGRFRRTDEDSHGAMVAARALARLSGEMSEPRAIVVCPVLPYPPVTGGQTRTLRLLEAVERAGARPHVLSADDGSVDAAETLRARGWAVDVVPEPPPTVRDRLAQHLAPRPSPYLHGVASRLERLQAEGAALVQLEHTQSAYYPVVPSIPAVLSLHNLDSRLLAHGAMGLRPGSVAWMRARTRARAMRSVERVALPRADRVVCVSAADARAAARAGGNVVLAPNGVDDGFFTVPAAPGAEQAVFFGHFGYEPNRRGVERFVAEGWPEVLRRRPQATLAIAGGGMGPELRRRLEAVPGVRVLGLVDDLHGLLAGARAVVVPLWVGGGTRLKVLEALAAARPVVGTAVAVEGIGFTPGVEGLVGEAPPALAAGVAELLADPLRAAALGAAGRRLAEQFRWPRVLADLEAIYRGWIVSSSPPDGRP